MMDGNNNQSWIGYHDIESDNKMYFALLMGL